MPGVGMDYWIVATGDGPGINGGLFKRSDSSHKLNSFDFTILVGGLDPLGKLFRVFGSE